MNIAGEQFKEHLLEWYQKDPATNGPLAGYAPGFVDGVKFMAKSLKGLGISFPDQELFLD